MGDRVDLFDAKVWARRPRLNHVGPALRLGGRFQSHSNKDGVPAPTPDTLDLYSAHQTSRSPPGARDSLLLEVRELTQYVAGDHPVAYRTRSSEV